MHEIGQVWWQNFIDPTPPFLSRRYQLFFVYACARSTGRIYPTHLKTWRGSHNSLIEVCHPPGESHFKCPRFILYMHTNVCRNIPTDMMWRQSFMTYINLFPRRFNDYEFQMKNHRINMIKVVQQDELRIFFVCEEVGRTREKGFQDACVCWPRSMREASFRQDWNPQVHLVSVGIGIQWKTSIERTRKDRTSTKELKRVHRHPSISQWKITSCWVLLSWTELNIYDIPTSGNNSLFDLSDFPRNVKSRTKFSISSTTRMKYPFSWVTIYQIRN